MEQYIIMGVLVALLIAYFLYYHFKGKKEKENFKNVLDNIKEGNSVITTAGIIGKVVSVQEENGVKTVTIETGNNSHKGYLTFDIQAIYMVLDNLENGAETEKEASNEDADVEPANVEVKEEVKEEIADNKEEVKPAEKKKKSKSKKTK